MALFAEDIGLLEPYTVVRLLDECQRPSDTYDLLGGLFEAMNTPGISGGRFRDVPYFNGGLFRTPARVELEQSELETLREAAKFDWSKVRPEIFGSLFEHSLGKEERHAFGAHFTSAVDIMKIVGPTIVEPWRESIENAKSLRELGALLDRMERFTVLDPACGSGNFLYIAYRELKRLEARIYERMVQDYKSVNPSGRPFGFVNTRNFYGMDINPFAIEIAKVTMMLAHKLSIDELRSSENSLPLDNLDGNFIACDALIQPDGTRTPWPQADVIVGNPPFLGAKLLKPVRGVDYVNTLRKAYGDVPGMADYCVYWLRRAHDQLGACTRSDPVAGRAGLVGTQNIRNNQSRVGGLGYILNDGTVVEAVDNQPWSGEANVNVSIVNWVKSQDQKILPKTRRLWFKADAQSRLSGTSLSVGPRGKIFDLNMREVVFINSALSDQADVGTAAVLSTNIKPQLVFQGVTPGHKAFVMTELERNVLVAADRRTATIIHPYLVGDEILSGPVIPERFLLDFEQRSLIQAQSYEVAFSRVEERILPSRKAAAEKGLDAAGKMRPHHAKFLDRWWQLSWGRADMLAALANLPRYMVCSRVTMRPVFVFLNSVVRPGDALQVFAFADDYSFGILQSSSHWQWFIAKCSKLVERFRYTPESVFDTFPWPQSPSKKQVDAIANVGREIRRMRNEVLAQPNGSLRALYRSLELPGKNPLRDAHNALDAAVLAAFGFTAKGNILSQLLALNLEVAKAIEHLESVQRPGIPNNYPNPEALVTRDSLGG